jgi:hypothetical protein
MLEEDKMKVLVDTIIIHQDTHLEEHTTVQFYVVRRHKRRLGVYELQGEMNKIQPPTFDGENKKHEGANTFLLVMRK